MNSSSVIFSLGVLGIAIITGSAANTITFQPGISYSWIIPPQSRPPSLSQDRPSDDTTFDQRNESPIAPIGGYGHPPFYLRHSHEQLSLPNEFLISSSNSDSQRNGGGGGFSPMPLFRQLDPVDCDGDPTCPNFDITQQQQEQHHRQQSPTTIHQSNIDAIPFPSSSPAITPPSDYRQQPQPDASLGQPVSWPGSLVGAGAGGGGGNGDGIGLLFFVPESASHLPVEQLIRQQLALHRTQFPIDISINCEDAVGSSCRGRSRPPAVRLINLLPPPPPLRSIVRNTENGNYASLPLDEIDNGNSSGSGISGGGKLDSYELNRKWRTIGERLVRNNLQQRQQHLQQEQQQWQLQQNQQELSIGP
ncbi:uncharacterized protein LOC129952139 isoform X2 [Eupeodes corollae]|uniref:uncharacterized protein LOC129952139 isoform X2 n=1 Tax=Eupeodes corollae TaxID=290404 RepID=UPI00248F5D34|nr:uncharacterized protein LOC129952139 isoform X2 [Eupeodes corollae]